MESFLFGLSTTAIGMIVVFFGLAILILCIYTMSMFTKGGAKKEKAQPKAEIAPVEEPVEEPEAEDDGALVAVIAAAVAAMMGEDKNAEGGFVVRRIRRVSNAPAWQRSARDEQAYGRL